MSNRLAYSGPILNLNAPSLEGLSYLLRHKELWPRSFPGWNYSWTTNCAMGLAASMWPEHVETGEVTFCVGEMATIFRMYPADADRIFCRTHVYRHSGFFRRLWAAIAGTKVTPEMVADQIDEYVVNNKSSTAPVFAV